MNVAFIHYHLKTGGVTTVLRQQVAAISDTCDVLVLTGELPQSPLPCDTLRISGLGYDRPGSKAVPPRAVAEAVSEAIGRKWKGGCDLLHVHNPLLAKNRNFLKILKILQQKNIRLFLQVHDFAEDGRPLAFFSDSYPKDCHYGVINSRDHRIMLRAGLKREGVHKIYNTIGPVGTATPSSSPEKFVLYPIRAIRRKNIGEAVLLSLFFKNKQALAITLPPNSPSDKKAYAGWKVFVDKERLNVVFDIGKTCEYAEVIASAEFLITSSITEGFGLLFLESWVAGKLLWGRKLPEICEDFAKSGIDLGHLYSRLSVPVTWLGNEAFFGVWGACVRNAALKFDLALSENAVERAYQNATADGTIDFGLLNETFQKKIILKILKDPGSREHLIRLNPFLADPGRVAVPQALIERNRRAALKGYSTEVYRKTLTDIYAKVVSRTVRQQIDKNILISEFLDLENFSLLKWSTDD